MAEVSRLGWGFSGKPGGIITLCVALGFLFLGIGLFGAFAMTEIAQFLNWPREVIVRFYEFRWPLTIVMIAAFCGAIYLNYRYRFVPQFLSFVGVAGLAVMVFAIHFMVPYVFFPAQHHTAKYLSMEEAIALEDKSDSAMDLSDDDRVYVIEIDGDAVAYPQEILWVPHIAGDEIGGKDVVMAYCVLSNLPLAYGTEVGGQDTDFKVMMQVHNNLILKDAVSGEITQHILGETEFTKTPLQSYPVQMMPWGTFKALYSDGRVFFNNYDDDFMPSLWKQKAPPAMEAHFEGPEPLFPTLRLDDDRLPQKEQVWGIRIGDQEVAISREFLEANPISNIEVGGEPIVVAYFKDLDTVGAFSRKIDGKVSDVSEIDPKGNTPDEQTCVFASEINKYARLTYEHNYKDISPELFARDHFNDDILKITDICNEIPDFDILCAGFPCQPFSQAGYKKGFNEDKDERGNMFFHICRIIEAKRPKAFFLENVRHILKHDDGKTFEIIRKKLEEELNYTFHYKVIKASDYGLPQHRPRVFMIGFNKSGHRELPNFHFPEPIPLRFNMSSVFDGECSREIGFTLRVGGKGSGLHDRRNWDSYLVDGNERRLTSREGKIMMGFPDDFHFPVSEAQAMKQLGNSVAVDAVEITAEKLLQYLDQNARLF